MHKHSFFPKSRLVNIKHCDYKYTLTVRHIKGVTKKEMSQCILICFHYRGVAKLSIKKKKKGGILGREHNLREGTGAGMSWLFAKGLERMV